MNTAHELGKRGEALVAALLERHGWQVLHRNYRFGHKEIDLIVRRGGVVAFVEVKSRGGDGFGDPLEAVHGSKQRDLARAARAWVARHGCAADTYRFDAAAVLWPRGGPPRVRYVKDAWRL